MTKGYLKQKTSSRELKFETLNVGLTCLCGPWTL